MIESLTSQISGLQAKEASLRQLAQQAWAMGAYAAFAQYQTQANQVAAQVQNLQNELRYWMDYDPTATQLAEGGITIRPTYALIGEGKGGRQQEAVVPLDRFWAALEQLNASFERHLSNLNGLTREVARNTATAATEARIARYGDRTVSAA
jgi:hypothetical protein